MKFRLIFSILTFITSTGVKSQPDFKSEFELLLNIRGLTLNDISIPLELGETSKRNDNELMLETVERLMKNPLSYKVFTDSLLLMNDLPFFKIVDRIYELLDYNDILKYSRDVEIVNPKIVKQKIISINNSYNNLYKTYSKADRDFLKRNLLSLISQSEDVVSNINDIFEYNNSRDESIAVTKKTMETLKKVDIEKLFDANIDAMIFFKSLYSKLKSDTGYIYEVFGVTPGNSPVRIELDGGMEIIIGSTGDDVHIVSEKTLLVIDPSGDDKYIFEYSDNYFNNPPFVQVIIDLNGDDTYKTKHKTFGPAGGFFGAFMIFDQSGNDFYEGNNLSIASAICGTALIYDEGGNDIYSGNSFSIGAASFGTGIIIDVSGNDVYLANSYSQAFGMTMGTGLILDKSGNDSYLISSRTVDIGRYEDHYISMCQGYGLGVRPYYAGGIGLLIDIEGNDIYNTDIFGQGGAYWYALGVLIDKSGHDKYNGYQYSQGAGIHLAVGILIDYDGWDFYSSNGVSQGCGHDYGVGILHDVKGNDNYSAYSLSQGAGNANGIGILIDEEGRDGYLNKEPHNTRGYGNPRREFGSIGLLMDMSGKDYYSVAGLDSTFDLKSYWGGFADLWFEDQIISQTEAGYKVPVDSSVNYSIEEFFVMAKTIEPRFSLWQSFGERHLVKDSLTTAKYILKKLDTEDHRDAFLIRNLIFKIYRSVSDVFLKKLEEYKNDKSILSPEEVIFMAYLFGETRDRSGAGAMYELLYENDERIRSSALSTIGKIEFNDEDVHLKKQISQRITELYFPYYGSKIYRKNIAFAFKNVKSFSGIPLLFEMIEDEFYAVRFIAAEALCEFSGDDFLYIATEFRKRFSRDNISYISFLSSISKLNDEDVINFYNLNRYEILSSDVIRYAFAGIINGTDEKLKSILVEVVSGLKLRRLNGFN